MPFSSDAGAQPAIDRTDGFRLSKSRFLSGLQCLKRLYLEVHAPDLAAQPDEYRQAILDMGSEVGELARRRFAGGALVTADYRHLPDALRQTAELLAVQDVPAIFEAAVEFDRVLIRVDILARQPSAGGDGSRWRLIEVKSSARVKDIHLHDLAVQAHVLAGAGIELAGTYVLHIDTRYLYDGNNLDLDRLFELEDVTEAVSQRLPEVRARLAEMKTVLRESSSPKIEPGDHCHSPYDCPFWEHCIKDKPARWVYHLPGGNRAAQELIRLGVETIDDIPADFGLTVIQRRVKEGSEWVGPELKARLEKIRYPVHHVDFETFMPAIPKYPKTRPYQTIPTQWSNHIESEDGEVRHEEYLGSEPIDPRPAFIQTLLDSLGSEGSICVYSRYERVALENLAEEYPQYRTGLRRAIRRLWDLLPIIRDQYYHPRFEGSFSIKTVLPALVPDLTYADLEIREGGMAAQSYLRMVFEETDWIEKTRLREALMRYCARDTRALVEIRKALLLISRASGHV